MFPLIHPNANAFMPLQRTLANTGWVVPQISSVRVVFKLSFLRWILAVVSWHRSSGWCILETNIARQIHGTAHVPVSLSALAVLVKRLDLSHVLSSQLACLV